KSLHAFRGHTSSVWCVDISSLQSNNNNNDKSNSIGVIGGNGYTICSGSDDKTIRVWDIETLKQLIVIKGHTHWITSVRCGSDELINTMLSGSDDKSARLWDIRSGRQIQALNEHKNGVTYAAYSPFVVHNNEIGGNSKVICSGLRDGTIRFWDIRSNKNELYVINGNKEDGRVCCIKCASFNTNGVNLFYGSAKGHIHIKNPYLFFNFLENVREVNILK
ncbi:G-protein beta WD-40 repeats containing protein, partial [Reticulomyxa filosa]